MYTFREEEKPKFKLRNALILSLLLLLVLLWTADDENLFLLSAEEIKQLELQNQEAKREMTFRFLDEPEDDVEHKDPDFLSDANRIKKSQEQEKEPENDDPISKGNTYELAKSLAPSVESSSPAIVQPPAPEQKEAPEIEEALPEEPVEPEQEQPAEDPLKDVEAKDLPESKTENLDDPQPPGPGNVPTDPGAPKPFRRITAAERERARKMASREMSAVSVNPSSTSSETSYNNPNGSSAPFTGMSIETSRSDLGPYLKILKQLIKGNWRIPNIARFEVSGVAVVSFKIHKDGKFSDAMLVTESGYQPLDTSSLNAIVNTYQAPPLPQYVDEEWIPIRFAFYYNMRPNY